ncbi:MAG: nitrilase-related carbon-nitrogen hydrolase [Xanthomonadales bacterium]|nr:nitrilase-related carbon-nitrogen hydrolase [Xanthomonadales bacterium]
MPETPSPYIAVALQTACHTVNGMPLDDARAHLLKMITRVDEQIRGSKAFIGPDARLFVLPEYFMSGFPRGESVEHWAKLAAIADGGPEYEALSRSAQDNGVYIAGNAYELDENFPGLYFQTCFVISDSGELVLRYRRLISMFAPTPHDLWDRYLDLYGLDGVFPVADTELGRLAACASEEILYPEICRAHALRGAEVIVHSTAEVSSPLMTPKDLAKRARAMENMAYLVSANSGGLYGGGVPTGSTDGMSKVIDYKGHVLAEADTGESMCANAEINIAAVRHYRQRPGMPNLLARQRLELFAGVYGGEPVHPKNSLLDGDSYRIPERKDFIDVQRDVIQRLLDKGRI